MAKRDGDDKFGRQDVGSDRAKPGSETLPHRSGATQGEDLQEALGDDAELDVGMVSGDFPADLIPVGL
jgi:hypothetical protein